ncbi:MAG: HAMP domain-containing sensor histidine kinase [Acidobacteriota bacterium]
MNRIDKPAHPPPLPLRSIRRKALASLVIAGVALAPLVLSILWAGAVGLEDLMLRKQLERETARLGAIFRQTGERPQPSRNFTPYWPGDSLPEELAILEADRWIWSKATRIPDLPPGTYEIGESEYFVQVEELEAGSIFVFLDVTDQEPLEGLESSIMLSTGSALLGAVLAAASFLAFRLDRQFVEPVRVLAEATERWELDDWRSHPAPGAERDDELGVLARATRTSALRIGGFLERERNFTRNASHELRSPLTVVRGALELLQQQSGPAAEAPLARIERATKRMESTVETFLWLAREEVPVADMPIEVEPLLAECVEQLLAGNPAREQVELRCTVPEGLTITAHPQVLRVVFDNLIGNAVRHGTTGPIEVVLSNEAVEVRNRAAAATAAGLGADTGFGLRIVRQLCERSGWRLEIDDGEAATSGEGAVDVRLRVFLT